MGYLRTWIGYRKAIFAARAALTESEPRLDPNDLWLINLNPPEFMWERDYIAELTASLNCVWVDVDIETALSLKPRRRPILVWNSNLCSLIRFESLLRVLRPSVVIHLSDEWGIHAKATRWYPSVPLVLRQHHFPNYPRYPNAHVIPLGYMTGLLKGDFSISKSFESRIKPLQQRQFAWSFVGALKNDRQRLIDTFLPLGPHFVETHGGIAPQDLGEIYLNSQFCPGGRGNVRLDCFRLHEASLCGAIPVVVGSEKDVASGFAYHPTPPWIFARSWPEALLRCRQEADDVGLLEQRSRDVRAWWVAQIARASALLAEAVKKS